MKRRKLTKPEFIELKRLAAEIAYSATKLDGGQKLEQGHESSEE